MAPTYRHSKIGYLSFTSSTGGTVNFSSGVDESSLERTVETAEVTAYGDNDKVYLAGLRDATVSASGHFASTYDEKLNPLLGSTTLSTITWGPHGNTTGQNRRKFTASAILTSYSMDAPVGDKASIETEWQLTGAVTSTKF